MAMAGHSSRPIDVISLIEMPNAPSPAKPTLLVPMYGGEAVAARAEKAWRQIFAALFEGRIGIADGAIVADVAGEMAFRQPGLDRAPGLPRDMRSGSRIRASAFHVGAGSSLSWSMQESVCSHATWSGGWAPCARRARRRRPWVRASEQALRHRLGVAADADSMVGQADAVRIDVDLDVLGGLRPVVDAYMLRTD